MMQPLHPKIVDAHASLRPTGVATSVVSIRAVVCVFLPGVHGSLISQICFCIDSKTNRINNVETARLEREQTLICFWFGREKWTQGA